MFSQSDTISLNNIRKNILQESKKIKEIQTEKKSILSRIKKQQNSIYNIDQYLKTLDSIQNALNKQISTSNQRIKVLKKKISTKEKWIHQRIRHLFIKQNSKYHSFFNSTKEQDLLKNLLFIQMLNKSEQKIVTQLKQERIEYQNESRQLNHKKKTNKKFSITKAKENKQYKSKIAISKRKIKELTTNEKSRTSIIAELKLFEKKMLEQQKDLPKISFSHTQNTCQPLKDYKIFSLYGIHHHIKLKTKTKNLGTELLGNANQTVSAVAQGEVLYVNAIPGYNQGVIIYHGSKYYTIYGNLKNITVKKGDSVIGCQSIATLSNSNRNTDRTIYFEVRKNKTSIDPIQWLNQIR